ncbi:MAG: beta-lactamase family protein, partial [Brevundimonas sp.]|nr:beta-lactamase family protein [Brevundimonas sp.]
MTRPFHLAVLAAAAAMLLASTPAAAGPEAGRSRAEVDAFIRRAMDEVGVVPGLSIAVVEGEEVLFADGYGVADLATGAPVDAAPGIQ